MPVAQTYGSTGEVSGYRKVLILELKKVGFERRQTEVDRGRDYAKELPTTDAVQRDTEIIVYVLGASLETGLEIAVVSAADGGCRACPFVWRGLTGTRARALQRDRPAG